jgi:hypothetical protein
VNTRSFLTLTTALALLSGCETGTPTHALVENAYPPAADGGALADQLIVYRLWWTTTLFHRAIPPGQSSDEQRVVNDRDYAYALVARGWDPGASARPEQLSAMRSRDELSVERGATLQIRVSDQTFLGNCAADQPLSQADADFVTQRIFPGEFAGLSYDAASCTTSQLAADGGDAAD